MVGGDDGGYQFVDRFLVSFLRPRNIMYLSDASRVVSCLVGHLTKFVMEETKSVNFD
jgi:hypothetical protein